MPSLWFFFIVIIIYIIITRRLCLSMLKSYFLGNNPSSSLLSTISLLSFITTVKEFFINCLYFHIFILNNFSFNHVFSVSHDLYFTESDDSFSFLFFLKLSAKSVRVGFFFFWQYYSNLSVFFSSILNVIFDTPNLSTMLHYYFSTPHMTSEIILVCFFYLFFQLYYIINSMKVKLHLS